MNGAVKGDKLLSKRGTPGKLRETHHKLSSMDRSLLQTSDHMCPFAWVLACVALQLHGVAPGTLSCHERYQEILLI